MLNLIANLILICSLGAVDGAVVIKWTLGGLEKGISALKLVWSACDEDEEDVWIPASTTVYHIKPLTARLVILNEKLGVGLYTANIFEIFLVNDNNSDRASIRRFISLVLVVVVVLLLHLFFFFSSLLLL